MDQLLVHHQSLQDTSKTVTNNNCNENNNRRATILSVSATVNKPPIIVFVQSSNATRYIYTSNILSSFWLFGNIALANKPFWSLRHRTFSSLFGQNNKKMWSFFFQIDPTLTSLSLFYHFAESFSEDTFSTE